MNSDNMDNGGNGQQSHDQDSTKPAYTIPGILHFIQHEWSRFEMERSQWDVERAEYSAKVAFLEGERKGQDNLKRDLVRRIKMLEYALRQERARFHKLKYGTDLVLDIRSSKDHNNPTSSNDELKPNNELQQQQQQVGGGGNGMNTTNTLRHGRQLLRQYLQEVGYSETILDVRSQRVRALLSNNNNNQNDDVTMGNKQLIGGSGNIMNGMKNTGGAGGNNVPIITAANNENKKNNGTTNNNQGAFITEPNGKFTSSADDVTDDDVIDGDDVINHDDQCTDDVVDSASSDVIQDSHQPHHVITMSDVTQQDDDDDVTDQMKNIELIDDVLDGEADTETDNTSTSSSMSDDVNTTVVDDVTNATDDVMSEFDFLGSSDMMDSNLNYNDGEESSGAVKDWPIDQNKIDQMKVQFQKEKRTNKKKGSKRPVKKDLQNMLETLKGTSDQQPGSGGGHRITSDHDNNTNEEDSLPFTVGGQGRINDDAIENALGLGDLAGLTVANEADILCLNVSSSKEPYRRMWNPKYTLRSHFDGVRSVRFLPNSSGCITASEDHTLKLWNLNKQVTSKRNSSLDLDPIYSFRGHLGGVLCCEISNDGSTCFSGGIDSSIRCWSIPSITSDPYENYDPSVSGSVLVGHTDAVWSLSYSTNSRDQLLSASSDLTVRLWNPLSNDPLLQTYNINNAAAPTCVEFVRCDCNHAIVSHTDGKIVVQDLETGKTPTILQDSGDPEDRVNCVVSHPTMPITISAHDDRQIKFFDNTSGKKIHSMVAHLDVVSSLAVDPNGLYIVSGSHDSSIRLWNLDSKTCMQELTSHRKKFDESIYSVAFHPNASYIASGGADAMVKIFE